MYVKKSITTQVIDTYDQESICTIPDEVTPEFDLKKLNLNWSEKNLPEKIRTKHVHKLHPYLGKFIPQLVEVFLRKFFQRGQWVLDPFVGCGTTLVQALELGVNSIGIDISEFNVLLCKVKTGKYNLNLLEEEIKDILLRTNAKSRNVLGALFIKQLQLKTVDNEYLSSWFHPNALHELLVFRDLIPDYTYQDVLKIILSRAARSARLTTHFDLDFPKKPQTEPYYCRKHRRICKPTDEAYKFLRRYGYDTLKRLREFSNLRSDARVDIIHGDSRKVKLRSIDGVITSPPYVGLIDYHEQHRYAYELLNLKDQSEYEIGSASNGQSKKAKEKYIESISDVLINIKKSLKKNGKVIIVANDKWELYEKIRQRVGLKKIDNIVRHVNRRTGRRTTPYFETIFIWEKSS